ncbi:hypothetical protein BCR36DRAFT_371920 [Piromyces finnis]|uniref:Uncharacterized protein n=1 Tax=Piromyces finnis TaxID=1754191 RepID=A0A1Y1V5M9_9FUNG|nr:hypothetical protein BCR36DRAFT_371920 [Piromyces finnis]|eukprot:ORX47126.1 hypothetical protein BCR36DRAFT_371920 [Piromyces finnis]
MELNQILRYMNSNSNLPLYKYGSNIKKIKDDTNKLNEGINKYSMESFKLNDKNDKNNSNNEKYYILDIVQNADIKNQDKFIMKYKTDNGNSGNGNNVKKNMYQLIITFFNHNYFESIDSINPNDSFLDYENNFILTANAKLNIDTNYAHILTPSEYNLIKNSNDNDIKKYANSYTAITIGDVEDDSDNLYIANGGERGKMILYVFSKDGNNNIKIKNLPAHYSKSYYNNE